MEKHEIGDEVYIDGYTSFAQQNAGICKIKKVESRFDELTGEKFLIYLVEGYWFDSRNGGAYKNDKLMYYIEDIV